MERLLIEDVEKILQIGKRMQYIDKQLNIAAKSDLYDIVKLLGDIDYDAYSKMILKVREVIGEKLQVQWDECENQLPKK